MADPHERDWDDFEDDGDDWDDGYCARCDGEGFLLACPDDMCRAIGGCDLPGPGCLRPCPDCGGSEVPHA